MDSPSVSDNLARYSQPPQHALPLCTASTFSPGFTAPSLHVNSLFLSGITSARDFHISPSAQHGASRSLQRRDIALPYSHDRSCFLVDRSLILSGRSFLLLITFVSHRKVGSRKRGIQERAKHGRVTKEHAIVNCKKQSGIWRGWRLRMLECNKAAF